MLGAALLLFKTLLRFVLGVESPVSLRLLCLCLCHGCRYAKEMQAWNSKALPPFVGRLRVVVAVETIVTFEMEVLVSSYGPGTCEN